MDTSGPVPPTSLCVCLKKTTNTTTTVETRLRGHSSPFQAGKDEHGCGINSTDPSLS